jgi:hypothetical protein
MLYVFVNASLSTFECLKFGVSPDSPFELSTLQVPPISLSVCVFSYEMANNLIEATDTE